MSLAFTPIFQDVLCKMIEEEISAEVGSLVQGSAKDYADYRGRCEKIAGLRLAITLAETTREKILGN